MGVNSSNQIAIPEVYIGIFVIGFGVIMAVFLVWYIIMRRRG